MAHLTLLLLGGNMVKRVGRNPSSLTQEYAPAIDRSKRHPGKSQIQWKCAKLGTEAIFR